MTSVLSIDSVVHALRSGIPDAEWFLSHIESEQGWLRFPPTLTNAITNLKIENYPLLYANENAMATMLLRGFLSDEELIRLNSEFESLSPEERGYLLTEFAEGLTEAIDQVEIPKTPEEQEAAHKAFLALSKEEQQQTTKSCRYFLVFFFTSFFQQLSIMVHGEKLTSLVSQAVAGDDVAFAKAIQIDGRILTEYPYFRERFARARLEGDSKFCDLVSYRISHAPYRGKIRYKTLWLALSMLDMCGFLDTLKHREILDICDEVGVGTWGNRIQDVKYLSKRIGEYREFQKRGIVPTP